MIHLLLPYNLRYRVGRLVSWKWMCRIGWHAKRMEAVYRKNEPVAVVYKCACCNKPLGGEAL